MKVTMRKIALIIANVKMEDGRVDICFFKMAKCFFAFFLPVFFLAEWLCLRGARSPEKLKKGGSANPMKMIVRLSRDSTWEPPRPRAATDAMNAGPLKADRTAQAPTPWHCRG
jgi:hypothetical protein